MKKILLGAAAILAILAVVIQLQPKDFRVERSLVMNAPVGEIYDHVNNLKRWERWSPWAKMDPEAKVAFSGPDEGKDAAMSWDGTKSGAGMMTVTDAAPNDFVKYRLDFTKPFASTANAEFILQPESGGTKVTWSMYGENNFIGKAISLVMNCEAMIGPQFEEGLASIKTLVEKPTPVRAPSETPATEPAPVENSPESSLNE